MTTALTASQLRHLREQAARTSTPFVDPAQLARVQQFVTGRHAWAEAILGKRFALRGMTCRDLVLLDLAARAEPFPPEQPRTPPVDASQCAADIRRAAAATVWRQLAQALPVRVSVAYNYSGPRHLESYVSGAEHIIVREPLHAGRLHRDAGRSLCWTPSRARRLFFSHLDDPADRDRIPTCKACLRITYRLIGITPDGILLIEGSGR
ncbi:hypothetical protein [Amycolatopsis alba]|uniref:Uncharacterized protein n=1 Tax=Amycolatopsis alba DSM 44262 TaxID=1125972 RepID=A0A229RM38_AMYAL|nr:hypothetical protein [Amycolatopsis alba]OXM47521.1 hypothetical protein CFP75_23855 [Amycolatopsis alba DSM 44262]